MDADPLFGQNPTNITTAWNVHGHNKRVTGSIMIDEEYVVCRIHFIYYREEEKLTETELEETKATVKQILATYIIIAMVWADMNGLSVRIIIDDDAYKLASIGDEQPQRFPQFLLRRMMDKKGMKTSIYTNALQQMNISSLFEIEMDHPPSLSSTPEQPTKKELVDPGGPKKQSGDTKEALEYAKLKNLANKILECKDRVCELADYQEYEKTYKTLQEKLSKYKAFTITMELPFENITSEAIELLSPHLKYRPHQNPRKTAAAAAAAASPAAEPSAAEAAAAAAAAPASSTTQKGTPPPPTKPVNTVNPKVVTLLRPLRF